MRRFLQGMGAAGCAMMAVAAVGCHRLPPPTPLADLNQQQQHGHAVFQTRCGACHYDRKDGPLHGPSLAGIFKKQALPSGAAATDERVTATVVHGRNQMPAMGQMLEPGDMDDLLAYLHTL